VNIFFILFMKFGGQVSQGGKLTVLKRFFHTFMFSMVFCQKTKWSIKASTALPLQL